MGLHGKLYEPDLGYSAREARKILRDHGIACSGICGMFSPENELASTPPTVRQRAIDYIKRNVEFGPRWERTISSSSRAQSAARSGSTTANSKDRWRPFSG